MGVYVLPIYLAHEQVLWLPEEVRASFGAIHTKSSGGELI